MPLICTIELSKTGGVTVKVENGDDKITQTIVMNGTTIVTQVKGSDATSKITQDQKTVKVEVKDFIVEAETITCKSTKATSHKSDDTFAIESTKAMTIKSSDACSQEATKAFSIKSGTDALSLEAMKALSVKSSTDAVTIQATKNVEAKATLALKLEGATGFEVKGLKGDIKGDLTVKIDTVKLDLSGSGMETLSGGLIKIG
jgi:hypothetical protein